MSVYAVVLAAGRSERFGRDKLTLRLGGRPLWRWSFDTLLRHTEVKGVGLVVAEDRLDEFKKQASEALFVVAGGSTRQQSTAAALAALPSDAEWIVIHDGARPFVSRNLISRAIQAAQEHGAAFPAIKVTDTIKQVTGEGIRTPDRSQLVAVQTPQVARVADLRRALSSASPDMTDDMVMLENIGVQTHPVEGEAGNIKITTTMDYEQAEARVQPIDFRVGFGYDIHRFSDDPTRPLMLGGLQFEGAPALEGHSDADVLLHAVVDALLGAASLGDIGLRYPNTDPRYKNMPSSVFVEETRDLLKGEGWTIANLDMTVLAEMPKLMPRRLEITSHIAQLLQMEPDRVSIKATTHEGLGAIGRGEGIVAQAVALIQKFPQGGSDGSSCS